MHALFLSLFWACFKLDNPIIKPVKTNNNSHLTVELSPIELPLVTTLAKIEATELWERELLVQITPDGIYVEKKKVVSLSEWKIDPPEQKEGHIISSLFESLDEQYHNNTNINSHVGNTYKAMIFNNRMLIAAHPKAPFYIIRDVLYNSGQAQYSKFGFLVDDPRETTVLEQLETEKISHHLTFTPSYNTAPVLQKVELIPEVIEAGEPVTCKAYNIFDAEEDRVSFKYQWIFNGTWTDVTNEHIITENANDKFQCIIIVTDGMAQSQKYYSNTITVREKTTKQKDSNSILTQRIYSNDYWSESNKQVYPNCIDEYTLSINSTSQLHLPKIQNTDGDNEIQVRGSEDTNSFIEWTKAYQEDSIAGHKRLIVQQSRTTPIETFLNYTSIWSSNAASVVIVSGGFNEDQTQTDTPIENSHLVLKPVNNRYPVVVIDLPAIYPPSGPNVAPNCIGKNGKRYTNHNGWVCNTQGSDIDCMSIDNGPQAEHRYKGNNILSHMDQSVFSEEQQCTQDADCILINKNCCPCHSGGEQTAIHNQYKQDVSDRREIVCASVGCLTVINEAPICKATEAVCVDSTCQVKIPQ